MYIYYSVLFNIELTDTHVVSETACLSWLPEELAVPETPQTPMTSECPQHAWQYSSFPQPLAATEWDAVCVYVCVCVYARVCVCVCVKHMYV